MLSTIPQHVISSTGSPTPQSPQSMAISTPVSSPPSAISTPVSPPSAISTVLPPSAISAHLLLASFTHTRDSYLDFLQNIHGGRDGLSKGHSPRLLKMEAPTTSWYCFGAWVSLESIVPPPG